ncbi:hypothetical protein [Trichormus sp. NMC-1]|uniref:hypothetical protein n=1 Tax=Trichormus sp. NMC-1 TaxID=1853259 RepID=UPI000B1D71F2|nr:hypothetical protein [Trichormus sp. NMC-1]
MVFSKSIDTAKPQSQEPLPNLLLKGEGKGKTKIKVSFFVGERFRERLFRYSRIQESGVRSQE